MTKSVKEAGAAIDNHAKENETDDEVYDVKRIAGHKLEDGVEYFLIEWDGYPDEDNTWEETHNVLCKGEIQKFHKKYDKQFKSLGWKPPAATGRNYKQLLDNVYDPDDEAYFSLKTWYFKKMSVRASSAKVVKRRKVEASTVKETKISIGLKIKKARGSSVSSPMVLSDSDDNGQDGYAQNVHVISSESSPETEGNMAMDQKKETQPIPNHIITPNQQTDLAIAQREQEAYPLVRVDTRKGAFQNKGVTIYAFANLTPTVTVVNDIDDEHYPKFTYITDLDYFDVSLPNPEFLDGCSCFESMTLQNSTISSSSSRNYHRKGKGRQAALKTKTKKQVRQYCCSVDDGMNCHDDNYYNDDGTLFDMSHRVVRECNINCSCHDSNHRCKNRVVTQGRQYPMEVYKTKEKGWAVRCPVLIPRGSFIEEYVGEVITAEESSRRAKYYSELDKSYLFAMDITANYREHTNVVDASAKGNVSRFFNHSCNPNAAVYAVFSDSADELLHRLAFFAVKDILPNTEICFDYTGGQGATMKDGAVCYCREFNCKGFF